MKLKPSEEKKQARGKSLSGDAKEKKEEFDRTREDRNPMFDSLRNKMSNWEFERKVYENYDTKIRMIPNKNRMPDLDPTAVNRNLRVPVLAD